MPRADGFGGLKISNRAGQTQNTVIPPCAEAEFLGGFSQQFFSFGIGRSHGIQHFTICMRVKTQPLDVKVLVTPGLNFARCRDPGTNFCLLYTSDAADE